MIENHDGNCFYGNCRQLRLQAMGINLDTLYQRVRVTLPRARDNELTALFNIRKREILAGKRYRDISLHPMNNPRLLERFKCWARTQQRYQRFIHGTEKLKKDFDDHCKYINDCATCAEKWSAITLNLNDARITNIDARALSVNQLARAVSLNWCLYHNARCTPTTAPPEPGEEGTYSRDDVREVHDLILNQGVLDKINYDPVVTASFMKSVALAIMKTCRREVGG